MIHKINRQTWLLVCASGFLLMACAANPTAAPTAAVVAAPKPIVPTSAPALPQATAVPVVLAAAPTAANTVAAPAATQPAATAIPPTSAAPAQTTIKKLNLNTTSNADFLKVPNVGNNMLREFNEYRPWVSILQFRKEIGKYVNAAQVAGYEQYVYVPVKFNTADADTLQQLPGVDKAIAAQLIAARPFANKDAFLKKLGDLVGAAQLAAGASYVE